VQVLAPLTALRAQERFSTKSAQDLRLRAAAVALTVGRTLLFWEVVMRACIREILLSAIVGPQSHRRQKNDECATSFRDAMRIDLALR